MRHLVLILLLLPVLAACATLSEDACHAGDWAAIGRADGAEGRTPAHIGKHAKACAEYGIRPDAAAWEAGRREGLRHYCTPFNAYAEGADGRRLSPVCPDADLALLADENHRGMAWYRLGHEIAGIESDIDRINARLAEMAADDPARASLAAERSFLRLDLLRARAERAHYRY